MTCTSGLLHFTVNRSTSYNNMLTFYSYKEQEQCHVLTLQSQQVITYKNNIKMLTPL